MLRRNFISMIPPGLLSLFSAGEHTKLALPDNSDNIIYESYTKIRKINDRIIYETTETKVNINGRTDITELIAPNVITLYCYGCTQLTKLELPVADYVNCGGCTKLKTIKWNKQNATS